MTPSAADARPARRLAVPILVALGAFLPFFPGVLLGQSLFFRDLSQHFFPLRRFEVAGLLAGEARYWNPYVHEGEQVALPPVSYPLDLLQLLAPDERGFTLLLALHVPFAALAFRCLGRALGLSETASSGGALVYALGGFSLSSLNLYVYVQAIAWAPLTVLALLRASQGGGRRIALAGLATAVLLSTTAVELAAQALLFALLLAGAPSWSGWARIAAATALGGGLAAPTLFAVQDALVGSERAAGFPASVVLAHSVHPLTLVQVLIASFHGDLADISRRFWGQNFFPRGFPYFLSLYLGAVVVALAVVGGRHGGRYRTRLLIALLAGLVVCLGRWIGLEPVVEQLAALRKVRYPVKAFFTVHLAAALLASLGLHALRDRPSAAWRWLAACGLLLGGLLTLLPVSPHLVPETFRWFVAGFFPADQPWPSRLADVGLLLADARTGGLLALAAAGLAVGVLTRRVRPEAAAALLAVAAAADLLRAGVGLNPMVTAGFYRLSPESQAIVSEAGEGRVFTCHPTDSNAYLQARAARIMAREPHEAWTFAAMIDTLTPYSNLSVPVRTAYGVDLTMFVPRERVLPARVANCADPEAIVERLGLAGVTVVLSLDPLSHPRLELTAIARPRRIEPLAIHVYRLLRPLPLVSLDPLQGGLDEPQGSLNGRAGEAGRILESHERPGVVELELSTDRAAALVVRQAHAAGWRAWLDGVRVPVQQAGERHLGIAVPEGRHHVRLAYRPPGLAAGLTVAAAALVTLTVLVWPVRFGPLSPRAPD